MIETLTTRLAELRENLLVDIVSTHVIAKGGSVEDVTIEQPPDPTSPEIIKHNGEVIGELHLVWSGEYGLDNGVQCHYEFRPQN